MPLLIQKKVDEVAAFLDEDKPGWKDVLTEKYGDDLAGLMVSDPFNCVFSVLYGDFDVGADHYKDSVGQIDYMNHRIAFACLRADDEFLRDAWLNAVRS